ncbi:MAG TPA: shikimate dehydrogenase [Candidatus Bathyarchaeota archaeon]|nr:shikimate dehydrogenase [Candidatus Bathyarchaeota archaeon]
MAINGKTRVCAVIGDPVEHSLSPAMHNAAFQKLGLNLVYVAFKVTRNELKEAISGAKSLGLRGLNVTMPHKNAVIKYLDETDSTAEAIGAVNTILNEQGKLVGYNTDGKGAMIALQESGIYPEEKKMLLLGAGGAAKAIAFQAAQEAEELVILNRTPEKAEQLAELLRKKFGNKVKGRALSAEILKKELKTADILVNATPVGMHPHVNTSPIPSDLLRRDLCVMDIVYNPLETKLVEDAKAVGAKVVWGLDMLLYQGAVSFEIWTNCPAPVDVMKKAALSKLAEQGVIVEGRS